MSQGEHRSYIPLPELSQHTDSVVFGNLGLPVGLDESRLLVNLQAFNRVQRAAGLGAVHMTVSRGSEIDYTPNVSSLGPDGSATIGAAARADKRALSKSSVRFPTADSRLDKPDVQIRIDGVAQDALMERKTKGTVAVRDSHLRAKVLDNAIRHGLYGASRQANVDMPKGIMDLTYYGAMEAINILEWIRTGGHPNTEQLATQGALLIGMKYMFAITANLGQETPRERFKRVRPSFFVGCAWDRYAAGVVMARTHRFIKAAR